MHILLTFLCIFPVVLQGEFVKQSNASLVGDYFKYCSLMKFTQTKNIFG